MNTDNDTGRPVIRCAPFRFRGKESVFNSTPAGSMVLSRHRYQPRLLQPTSVGVLLNKILLPRSVNRSISGGWSNPGYLSVFIRGKASRHQ